jgi:hypothetical protein
LIQTSLGKNEEVQTLVGYWQINLEMNEDTLARGSLVKQPAMKNKFLDNL